MGAQGNELGNSTDDGGPKPAQFYLRDLLVMITVCAAALAVARAMPAPLPAQIALGCYLLFAVVYLFFRARFWRQSVRRWRNARRERAELEQWLREKRSRSRNDRE